MDLCYLTRLPLEIFDAIALQLTALDPVGPPSILLPLMQTCKALHTLLTPHANPSLYARIFRQKFDVAAVTRRAFRPTPAQSLDQMHQYFAALRVFRRRDLRPAAPPGEELFDMDVEGALQIGVVMMLEDDGKNARQLVQWGHADEFVDAFVRSTLYDGAEGNDGWPIENSRNAHALWLMWLLTTEESLLREPPARRAQMMQLLLPFVYVPYRYPTALAPPNHYHIPPLPISPVSTTTTTIPTPHGPYPLYRTSAPISLPHFSSRRLLSRPPAAVAAKLLFFARTEVHPVPIPPHLDRTRADAHARGNYEVGPTREDVEEFNWGWTARPPGGKAWDRSTPGWGWDSGEGEDEEAFPARPSGVVEFPGFVAPEPVPRWVGKAPHVGEYEYESEYECDVRARGGKSRKWDADWFRMRMCGDHTKIPPRVPYGRVFEPFSLVGLWHGLMLIPGEHEIQNLMNNPLHPPHGLLTESALAVQARPMYVRFQELHGVRGEVGAGSAAASASSSSSATTASSASASATATSAASTPFALGRADAHDGMNNAWFASVPRVVPLGERGGGERVALDVGSGERGVYRRHRHCGEGRVGEGRGNEAFEGLRPRPRPRRCLGDEDEGDAEWEGYEHDEEACAACNDRGEFRRRLGRPEGPFGVGDLVSSLVGSGGVDEGEGEGEDEGEDAEEDAEDDEEEDENEDEDELMEPWDADETIGEESGVLPSTHEWARRGKGRCDGLAEVVVIGEPDPTHASAYHPFRYHGRIRPWDGLLLLVRTPTRPQDEFLGTTLFYGYLVGRDVVVGSWRMASVDPGMPAWEGAWCMSRRED